MLFYLNETPRKINIYVYILKTNTVAWFFSQSAGCKLVCSAILGLGIFKSSPGDLNEVAKLRTSVLELYILSAIMCFSNLGNHHVHLIILLYYAVKQHLSDFSVQPSSPGRCAGPHPRVPDSLK